MPRSNVIVLSDVHIGSDAPTVWYQRRVHEPYLLAALDWVLRQAADVREVVLLGDLVDVWTYDPSLRPPSMADIIAANPAVLGPDGALAAVVRAVPKVTMLLGNHDGTLTPDDFQALRDAVGPIDLVDEVHVLEGSTGAKTVFSHGHLWTMFNAPDERSPWNTLPIGHFVTRAFSYMMARKLAHGQTVADLRDMGYPNGFDLLSFVRSLSPSSSLDVAGLLLDYVSTASGMPRDLPIVLPDGSVTTLDAAKRVYADLFTRWVAKEQGSLTNALRAALADGSGEYLAWFAQRLAIEHSADLVVFGHTHTPVAGLAISPTDYVNSGFECASVPDNPPKRFTFTVVDLETASASIARVEPGTYAVGLANVPRMGSVVLPPAMDFSSYVRIRNDGGEQMTRTGLTAAHGYWVVPPPASIPPGGYADAWLQDYAGPQGTEGTVTYARGGQTLKYAVSCPTGLWSNTASGPGGDFIARSGSGDWQARGAVPRGGHPLQVRFGGPALGA